jgi:hypothetical protein
MAFVSTSFVPHDTQNTYLSSFNFPHILHFTSPPPHLELTQYGL